jgi:hypothetical protein
MVSLRSEMNRLGNETNTTMQAVVKRRDTLATTINTKSRNEESCGFLYYFAQKYSISSDTF